MTFSEDCTQFSFSFHYVTVIFTSVCFVLSLSYFNLVLLQGIRPISINYHLKSCSDGAHQDKNMYIFKNLGLIWLSVMLLNVFFVCCCCYCSYFLFEKIFIWLCWVLVSPHGIFSCGLWDLVPLPGIEPEPPALRAWSLKSLDQQRSPSPFFFTFIYLTRRSRLT